MTSSHRFSPVVLASLFALAALLSSCSTVRKGNAGMGEKGAGKRVEEPVQVGEELVRALLENNAKAFLRQLPESMEQNFGKKDFEKTRESMIKELGTPVSYTFLRNMAHPVATISLWVIRFERVVPDEKAKRGKKKLVMDVLFRAVYGKLDGKETLLSFNFY